jgi:hypothetical protein
MAFDWVSPNKLTFFRFLVCVVLIELFIFSLSMLGEHANLSAKVNTKVGIKVNVKVGTKVSVKTEFEDIYSTIVQQQQCTGVDSLDVVLE